MFKFDFGELVFVIRAISLGFSLHLYGQNVFIVIIAIIVIICFVHVFVLKDQNRPNLILFLTC